MKQKPNRVTKSIEDSKRKRDFKHRLKSKYQKDGKLKQQ